MSLEETADPAYAAARQQWQSAEQAARMEYLQTVKELQRIFEADCQPYRDAYNSAERAAWTHYQAKGHRNWDLYRQALNAVAAPDSPAATASPVPGRTPE